jgi:hypothetical protein
VRDGETASYVIFVKDGSFRVPARSGENPPGAKSKDEPFSFLAPYARFDAGGSVRLGSVAHD